MQGAVCATFGVQGRERLRDGVKQWQHGVQVLAAALGDDL